MGALELGKRRMPAGPRVDVQHDHARPFAGRNADAGARPLAPPPADDRRIGGRSVLPPGDPRVLARVGAPGPAATGAGAVRGELVYGHHPPALHCVLERRPELVTTIRRLLVILGAIPYPGGAVFVGGTVSITEQARG